MVKDIIINFRIRQAFGLTVSIDLHGTKLDQTPSHFVKLRFIMCSTDLYYYYYYVRYIKK